MSKIIVGSSAGVQGIRLSPEKRLEHDLTPESMRDNYFVEMYGVDKLGCDLSSRYFLGIIDQLSWAKRFTKKGSTVIIEKPEFGLSHKQKEVVLLSILHLVHLGHDVVIETSDRDFVLLVRLLSVTRKDRDGVKALMCLLGTRRHDRIWEKIFTEVLCNLHVEIAYNPIENAREA